jgi:hypothetical protein
LWERFFWTLYDKRVFMPPGKQCRISHSWEEVIVAGTHHILTHDPTDWILLAGCHYTKMHHPGAQICSREHIKGVFKRGPKPHKLHIIDHGDPKQGGRCAQATAAEMARDIFDSGIEDDGHAKVRLDICGAGGNPAGYTALAALIRSQLKTYRLFGPNCRIEVTGPLGSSFMGWATKTALPGVSKGRMVVDENAPPAPGAPKPLMAWYGDWMKRFEADPSNAGFLRRIRTLPPSQGVLTARALEAYTKGEAALKDFYTTMTTTYQSHLIAKAPKVPGHTPIHKKAYR